ncbi:MAG: disulfide bond formation protein B [Pseudomonadota bacterium]
MSDLIKPLTGWRWPALAVLVSLAMLGAAHWFEQVEKLAPCPLCLRQREVYWALIAMVAVGLALWKLRPTPRFIEGLNVLVGLVFVTGAGVAVYHMGVEFGWLPSGCVTLPPEDAAAAALDPDLGLGEAQATESCSAVPWSFLGLSMAAWNFVISLGLAAISFAVARETVRSSRQMLPL